MSVGKDSAQQWVRELAKKAHQVRAHIDGNFTAALSCAAEPGKYKERVAFRRVD